MDITVNSFLGICPFSFILIEYDVITSKNPFLWHHECFECSYSTFIDREDFFNSPLYPFLDDIVISFSLKGFKDFEGEQIPVFSLWLKDKTR